MENLNLKVTILINFCRCFFAATFTSAIILALMQINLIKIDMEIDLAYSLQVLGTVIAIYLFITIVGAIFKLLPMIIYVLLLPGYILADIMLYFLIKSNPIGYNYPLYTLRAYIPFAKE